MRLIFALLPLSFSLLANSLDKEAEINQPSSSTPYYYGPESDDFILYGDWIYWKPVTEGQLNFLYTTTTTTGTNSNNSSLNTSCLNYHYSNGFRAGLGYRFGSKTTGLAIRPWQLGVEYTQLFTNAFKPVSVVHTSQLSTPLLPSNKENIATYVNSKSEISLHYKRADFTLSWPIWLKSNVILKLVTGAIGAQFENKWLTNYATPFQTGGISTEQDLLKWKWQGGGLFGKGDIFLPVGAGFGFFANTGFGLLLGTMHQKEQNNYFAASTGDSFQTSNSYKFASFQSMFQFGAGIDWKYRFENSSKTHSRLLYVSAGWDCTWWFKMNAFGRVNDRGNVPSSITGDTILSTGTFVPEIGKYFSTSPTDLIFQGASVRMGLDF